MDFSTILISRFHNFPPWYRLTCTSVPSQPCRITSLEQWLADDPDGYLLDRYHRSLVPSPRWETLIRLGLPVLFLGHFTKQRNPRALELRKAKEKVMLEWVYSLAVLHDNCCLSLHSYNPLLQHVIFVVLLFSSTLPVVQHTKGLERVADVVCLFTARRSLLRAHRASLALTMFPFSMNEALTCSRTGTVSTGHVEMQHQLYDTSSNPAECPAVMPGNAGYPTAAAPHAYVPPFLWIEER